MARYAIDNLNAELPRAGSQEVVDISGEVLYRLSGFTFYNFYQTSIYDFSLPRTYGELASVLKNQIAIANAHY